MRTVTAGLIAALALGACASAPRPSLAPPPPPPPGPLAEAGQLLVVTTASWDAIEAQLALYERRQGAWVAVMEGVPAVVGRSGLAWGRGLPLDVQQRAGGPIKREGDGKAPAGLFALGTAFGFDAALPWASLPYRQLTPETECIDDARSRHYNAIVERSAVAVDWTSSEKMREEKLYRIGAVIQHNTPEMAPGGGSCIFLHAWRGPGRGTAGCTAMEDARLEELLRALDPRKNPAVLQVPRAVYSELKARYRLP
jgi:D-alanyl-D-alanine dipeptidase